MKLIKLTFLSLVLFMAFNVFAFGQDPQGKLAVQVVVSDSPEYINQWVKKSFEEPVFIKAIKEVKPEQTFYVAFIVNGYGVTKGGLMDIEADLILIASDGEVGFEQKNACSVKGPAGLSAGFVMLDPALDLTLQKENPSGVYTIKAEVRDKVLNQTANGEYKITLTSDVSSEDKGGVKQEGAKSLEISLQKEGVAEEDFVNNTTYYYKNQQPDKLLSILKAVLAQDDLISDAPHFGPFAHLFATVAHNNKAFLDKLLMLKDQYSGIHKMALDQIIQDAENFQSPMPNSAKDLDYLWAEFSATGQEEPVKKIISVLGKPDIRKEDKILIEPALTKAAAEWSLGANAKQHKKVYEIIQKESISATGELKEKLDKILGNITK